MPFSFLNWKLSIELLKNMMEFITILNKNLKSLRCIVSQWDLIRQFLEQNKFLLAFSNKPNI